MLKLIFGLVAVALSLCLGQTAYAQALPGFNDCSIASLSGSSQTAVSSNPQRKYLLFQNTGSSNVGINLAGGTAAIAGAGTITLVPGAAKEFSTYDSYLPRPPANAVTVIGTAAQPVACIEGK